MILIRNDIGLNVQRSGRSFNNQSDDIEKNIEIV